MSYRFACHQIELSFHRTNTAFNYSLVISIFGHNLAIISFIPIHNAFLFFVRLYYCINMDNLSWWVGFEWTRTDSNALQTTFICQIPDSKLIAFYKIFFT